MILQADAEGCVREVLVLAAALSIPDPRERPADREEAARQKHARFADEHSDFISYLNLWRYLREQRKERSGNAFRRMCREEFLHYLRIREWQDLVGQLRSIARDHRHPSSHDEPADPARVHAALMAGLLVHIGLREGDVARLPRRAQLAVRPRAGLGADQAAAALGRRRRPRRDQPAVRHGSPPASSRRRSSGSPGTSCSARYSEPHWDAQRGAAMAYERVTLYGLPLVRAAPRRLRADRAGVGPRAVHPARARRGRLADPAPLLPRQRRRCATELAEMEERARRRDLLVGDDEIYAFYDARIPADVVSARHFDAWWKKQRHRTPDLLTLTRDDLLRTEDTPTSSPDTWQAGDLALPVTYRFEPGAADDGVTVHVPVDVLARLGGDEFAWQVPALREELVTALIRVAAEGPAPQLRSRARHRPRGAGRRSTPGRNRCWRRCSASCTGAPACSCRSTPSTWTSCRRTCG